MSLSRSLTRSFPSVFRTLTKILGAARQEQFLAMVSPELVPVAEVALPRGGSLRFYCPGELPLWRARTFFDKEPETLNWIDGFAPGATMWDVGANVGLYSLYAAARGCRVWAFEPSAANYVCLTTNVSLNRAPVTAFCLAFAESSGLGRLELSDTAFGAALHQFRAGTDVADQPAIAQGMLSFSIDDFITRFAVQPPDHLKIDVDGLELGILRGARGLLARPELKSVLIELDEADRAGYDEAIAIIRDSGLTLREKCRAPMNDGGANDLIHNHIFVRT